MVQVHGDRIHSTTQCYVTSTRLPRVRASKPQAPPRASYGVVKLLPTSHQPIARIPQEHLQNVPRCQSQTCISASRAAPPKELLLATPGGEDHLSIEVGRTSGATAARFDAHHRSKALDGIAKANVFGHIERYGDTYHAFGLFRQLHRDAPLNTVCAFMDRDAELQSSLLRRYRIFDGEPVGRLAATE